MKKLSTLCFMVVGLALGLNGQVTDRLWQPVESGLKYPPTAITNSENTLVVAYKIEDHGVKGNTFGISYWNGTNWASLPPFLCDEGSSINAIRFYKSDLYIAGKFNQLGSLSSIYNIAKWNGKEYASVPVMSATTPKNTDVIYRLDEYDGLLVAAGSFSNSQVSGGQNLAFFNGTKWTTSGIKELEGINGAVFSTAEFNGDFYAGGNFTKVGSTESKYLARFESGELVQFKGNIVRPHKMVVASGKLIGAGALASNGDPKYFVKIDKDTVYKINSDFKDINLITDMVSDGDVVYASGIFTFPAPINTVYLVKYENGVWSPLPGGLLKDVEHLLFFRKTLFASGNFESYNGISLNYVARVNTTTRLAAVRGQVYHDKKANCMYDGRDENLSSRVILINPGNILVRTGVNGFYTAYLEEGKYTISVLPQEYWKISACSQLTKTVELEKGKLEGNVDFPLVQTSGIKDLSVDLVSSTGTRAVLSNTQQYFINYENLGSSELIKGQVSLKYDSRLNSLLAFPPPSERYRDSAVWRISDLSPGEEGTIKCRFKIDQKAEDELELTASISQPAVENDDDNNSSSLTQQIMQEDVDIHKYVSPGATWSDTAYMDPETEAIQYHISFANYTEDTVRSVYVIDTVNLNSSIASMDDISFSHHVIDASYPGPAFSDYFVLVYKFEDINLPPNPTKNGEIVNDEGHATFQLSLRDNLVDGQQFSNTATVVFDYNFDKQTNTVIAIVDEDLSSAETISLPQVEATLYPNPTNGLIHISSSETAFSSYEVWSISGKKLSAGSLEASNEINLHELHSGMYVLRILGDTGMYTARIVRR